MERETEKKDNEKTGGEERIHREEGETRQVDKKWTGVQAGRGVGGGARGGREERKGGNE